MQLPQGAPHLPVSPPNPPPGGARAAGTAAAQRARGGRATLADLPWEVLERVLQLAAAPLSAWLYLGAMGEVWASTP